MAKKITRKYGIILLTGLLSFLTLLLYLIEILTAKKPLSSDAFLKSIAISIPFMVLITLIDYKIVVFINNNKWFSKHLSIRIIVEIFAISMLAALFVIIGNIPFYVEENIWKYLISLNYLEGVVASILLNIFAVTMIEFVIQNQKNQSLKEENIRMQYLQLKDQINPHFLFNSLNILVSLINKNTEHAINYTKKLSEVYRYVLSYDLVDTVTLEEEINFIYNYIEILKIRFGEGLKTSIDINEADRNKKIPPMTLQVLVENSVKHNALNIREPLCIEIISNGSYVRVSNNIVPRIRVEKGMGIGLKNLKKKYHYISDKEITIEKDNKMFNVKIPLL